MENKDFNSLVGKVANLLIEEAEEESKKHESPEVDAILKNHGYSSPQPGDDGHTTFTNKKDEFNQILIDVPGGEWHHMTKGVITKVGELKGDSLEQYLNEIKPEMV
jgi:hypothetical protein